LKLPKKYPILIRLAEQQPNLTEHLTAFLPPESRPEPMPPIETTEQAIAFAYDLVEKATPKWLIGFRNVTNATNERTAIFSVLPRVGVGHSAPLLFPRNAPTATHVACLLANFTAVIFDYLVRQKLGGMNLTFGYVQQLPVLPPSAYTSADLLFIVPRVLELVYTSWDIKPFADDVWRDADEGLREVILRQWEENRRETGGNDFHLPDWAKICPEITPADPSILHSPPAIRYSRTCPLPPFKWDEDRRAQIRAELDAYYAHLYGLNRKQLRYILDPADLTEKELADILDPWEEVTNPLDPEGYAERQKRSTFPGETFRVLKENELRQFGEYRTRRLILEAWERLGSKRIQRGD
jgi:hypothetical protein